MDLTVIGIGKLGLGLSLILEKSGYNVLGVDTNNSYINSLNNSTFKSSEPEINDYLRKASNFRATTNLLEGLKFSDFIFILVPTPNGGGDNFYDHSILSSLFLEINKLGCSFKHFIIGCTVMPQYIDRIANSLINNTNTISYNPEFVALGEIIKGYLNPDIVLLGTTSSIVQKKIHEIYNKIYRLNSSIIKKNNIKDLEKFISERENELILLKKMFLKDEIIDLPINISENNYIKKKISKPKMCIMKPLEAEIVKISLNAYITTKISFANMISDLCDENKANKFTVLDAIGSDSRIGNKYFNAGYSYGGPCFPRDTKALVKLLNKNNICDDILLGTNNYNEYHVEFQTLQLLKQNKQIYIIENVSYKEKTKIPIIEESAKLKIAKNLVEKGKTVIIKDFQEIIDEVKKEFGNLFSYQISSTNLEHP